MLLSFPLNRPGVIAGFGEAIVRPTDGKFRMNFTRFKCDERAMQSRMRNDAFALQVRNER
jgi:hypothetical protein